MYENFQIPGVSFDTFGEGLTRCTIDNANGRAVFTTHGAHFLSFAPAGREDLLWVSGKSLFRSGKAIRGGIPVCWPYFGPASDGGPAHGYARQSEWSLDDVWCEPNGDTSVALSLPVSALPSAYTDLSLRMEARIGRTLTLNLITVNGGKTPFRLSQALHSYFAVFDISAVSLDGLSGADYLDKANGGTSVQSGEITVSSEVDRIYIGTGSTCLLRDSGKKHTVSIAKIGSASTVVWNPWVEKSIRLSDFGDHEYRSMLCVETVNAAADARVLQPGESHSLTAVFSLLSE